MTDQPVQTNIQREHLGDYKEVNLMNKGSILLILKDLMKIIPIVDYTEIN